ncbi:MAG TPA: methylated-DNA--[protein]-cysteine S-methyltransferase [Steroidobacteraceae bacterium]|nr:methylated-DNA--[protein]-cysteine S-methyltransferase [Steroidobacteraceae bacterium]
MDPVAYVLFRTPVGYCALAWNGAGVLGVQLPERSAAATRARLRRRFPGAIATRPPRRVRQAVAAIERLLRGGRDTLADIALDLSRCSAFHRRVYEIARTIPAGATWTYGALAARAGSPGAARAVGQAMARNPFPLVVPCHRVTGAQGWAGGFSAHGGVNTKFRLLRIEGARLASAAS